MTLVLGVRRPSKEAAASRSKEKPITIKDWPRLRDSVLQRDRFTCQYCGFQAKKFQRVHFRNGEPAAPKEQNLATACIFCEQCCELESVARMHSGILVWLPELSQTDLHHFCRGLYVANVNEDQTLATTAQRIIDQLQSRRTEAKKRLGFDNPQVLATAMIEQMDDKTYAARAERLDGIRLLPLPVRLQSGDSENNQFPNIVSYWASMQGPYVGGTPQEWLKIAAKLSGSPEAPE